jgi:hypothetical protein
VQGAPTSPTKQIATVPTIASLDTPLAQNSKVLDQAMYRHPSQHQPQRPNEQVRSAALSL